MPRPLAGGENKAETERLRLKREKQNERAKERGREQSQRIESRIKTIIGSSKEPISYTQLLKEVGCRSDRTLKMHLKRMLERQEIAKGNGKRGRYFPPKIADYEPLEYLGLSVLHQSLKKGAINEFNQYLGSFVTYTLKHYEVNQAMSIISTMLREVEQYLKSESKVESAEWELWRDLDSREFIIKISNAENTMREAIDYGKFEQKWLKVTFILREIDHMPK